jgi:hypothetical protein
MGQLAQALHIRPIHVYSSMYILQAHPDRGPPLIRSISGDNTNTPQISLGGAGDALPYPSFNCINWFVRSATGTRLTTVSDRGSQSSLPSELPKPASLAS